MVIGKSNLWRTGFILKFQWFLPLDGTTFVHVTRFPDTRATPGVVANGLHALADICVMKQREELIQGPQFPSLSQESNITQARDKTEPFPEEVLRTLCLMRNSTADLKRLLAVPKDDESRSNRRSLNASETRRHGERQSPRQSSKDLEEGKRLDKEVEKMMKYVDIFYKIQKHSVYISNLVSIRIQFLINYTFKCPSRWSIIIQNSFPKDVRLLL